MKTAWMKHPYQHKITIGESSLDDNKDFATLDPVKKAVRAAMEKNPNIVDIMECVLMGIDPDVTRGTTRTVSFAVAAALESLKGMHYDDDGDEEDEEQAA